MYLKSILIQGFKSFANKIEFEFKSGITGIVGPNGSGKSNVADAVRWVLGEQSAKELRGSSMQDVIFSGTENRKPMGYAFVAITLNNADHALNLDYEEVTVGRRVYRSGESEYLINGKACRLKDVAELFYDTGIGKEGYSIIGQGQIDKILSGKIDERRELFDEAAGIVKFKRRKAVSLKKLAEENENLVRINDILSELEERIEPLSKQAETAKIYLAKRDELKALEIDAFLQETELIQKKLTELKDKTEIAKIDQAKAQEAYEQNRLNYEGLGSRIGELDKSINEKRDEINNSTVTRGQMEGRINVLKEKINSLKLIEKRNEERIAELERDKNENGKELEALRAKKAALDEKVEKSSSGLFTEREELSGLENELKDVNAEIEGDKNRVVGLLSERVNIKSDLGRYETMLEQTRIKRAESKSRLLRQKSDEAELHDEADRWLKELEASESAIQKLQGELEKLKSKIEGLNEKREKRDRESRDLDINYHERRSRLESLRNLAERYEGYGNAVRKAMELKRQEKGIAGVVADLIQVDEKYEVAIETALGGSLQNIVTKDEDTAKRLIRHLKETRAGRATFLPMTSIQERGISDTAALRESGVIGTADSLVRCEKKYELVAKHLLGGFLVVDNVDRASEIARKYRYRMRIVTLQGESLNPGGSISGGAFQRKAGLLGRGRELEEIEKELKEILKKKDACLSDIEDYGRDIRSLSIKEEELKAGIKDWELKQNECALELKNLKDRENEILKGSGDIERENEQMDSQIKEIEHRQKKIQEKIEESEEEERRLTARVESFTIKAEKLELNVKKLREAIGEADRDNAALLQEQGFIERDIDRISGSLKRMEDEEGEILSNEKAIEGLVQELESFGDDNDEKNSELKKLIDEKDRLSTEREEAYNEREKLSAHKGSLDRELDRLEREREKCEEEENSISAHMWESYELTRSAALEMKTGEAKELPELKKEIQAVKGDIRELGHVNVNAIEEYEELYKRFSTMDEQRNDIVKAGEDLEKIIADLNENMERQFKEKFAEIAAQYDEVFKELFGGGTGTLSLMDPENILETDIRITAQPPGKKLQNMMQLSGGEKALSAIALLFAIQNLKPSPFCLLDEIEAALDEANVDRFASYLSKLTEHTQFIVITHRRGTMMKADRLYGVTMQEKGVSIQVNVDLSSEEYV